MIEDNNLELAEIRHIVKISSTIEYNRIRTLEYVRDFCEWNPTLEAELNALYDKMGIPKDMR